MTTEELELRAKDNKEQIHLAVYNVRAKPNKWTKEYKKLYYQEYNKRPDVIARLKAKMATPEFKKKQKEYREKPGVKERYAKQQSEYRKDPDYRAKKLARGRRRDVAEKARISLIKRKYGLTKDEYDAMLSLQGGACACCETTEWGKKGPVIDHDHATGAVRGILCCRCNSSAGLMGDNPDYLLRLAAYLRRKND